MIFTIGEKKINSNNNNNVLLHRMVITPIVAYWKWFLTSIWLVVISALILCVPLLTHYQIHSEHHNQFHHLNLSSPSFSPPASTCLSLTTDLSKPPRPSTQTNILLSYVYSEGLTLTGCFKGRNHDWEGRRGVGGTWQSQGEGRERERETEWVQSCYKREVWSFSSRDSHTQYTKLPVGKETSDTSRVETVLTLRRD